MQPIRLEPQPTTLPQEQTKKPEKNPLLDLVPVNEEALTKVLNSQGFENILNTVQSLPPAELIQYLQEDLKDAYEDLSDYPKTIEELQQRFLIAQEHSKETIGSRDPLTANTLEYFNQRLTTITALEEIVKDKPILIHLLRKEQQRLAHLIVSLEKLLPSAQEAAA